ncbi:helix-turn-helix transcriptional regulator [bacterium]|nr:helix-turn-helix transcriptional regulator [bacterium]
MSDLTKKLGAKIQEIRKSKGITQEKLAELINMDTPNLSNIERGKKFMTANTLEKIVKALGIQVKDLFDFEHIIGDVQLKSEIKNQLDTLTTKELQYIHKTITNIKHLRK